MHNWIRYVSTKKVKSKETFICPNAEFDLISKGSHWPFSFSVRKSQQQPSSWNSTQLSCVNYLLQWWVEFRGVVPGVPWHPQIFADQLILSQPRGALSQFCQPNNIGTHGFPDLPTYLRPCLILWR